MIKDNIYRIISVFLLAVLATVMIGCNGDTTIVDENPDIDVIVDPIEDTDLTDVESVVIEDTIKSKKENMHIIFFDISDDKDEQSSTFIRTPTGKTLLYDSGSIVGGRIVKDILKRMNIPKLNLLIMTHLDNFHIGGFADIIENIEFDSIIDNGNFKEDYFFMQPIHRAIYNTNSTLKHFALEKHTTLDFDQTITLDLYAPYQGMVDEDGNQTYYKFDDDNSIGLKVKYFDKTLLLLGDCRSECEAALSDVDLDADILLIPSHGGVVSTSDELLERVSPEVLIITVSEEGSKNQLYAPKLEKLSESGIKILKTYETGHLVLEMDADGYRFMDLAGKEITV